MNMKEVKPIWIESIMSDADYKAYSKKYPSICNGVKPSIFECDFKWRYQMGNSPSEEEIKVINSRLDAVLLKAKIKTNAPK